MADEPKTPDQKSYEGWTESEIATDLFFDLKSEMVQTFNHACKTPENPTWFLNGRAAEILKDLERIKETLALLQQKVTDPEISSFIEVSLAKAKEYIEQIETRYKDPALRQRIAQVRKNLLRMMN